VADAPAGTGPRGQSAGQGLQPLPAEAGQNVLGHSPLQLCPSNIQPYSTRGLNGGRGELTGTGEGVGHGYSLQLKELQAVAMPGVLRHPSAAQKMLRRLSLKKDQIVGRKERGRSVLHTPTQRSDYVVENTRNSVLLGPHEKQNIRQVQDSARTGLPGLFFFVKHGT